MEQWHVIRSFENYEISSMGSVRSRRTGKILHLYKHNGYNRVALYKGNGQVKRMMAHRLVAEAFIANPQGFSQVNHKDGNKGNNIVENLEWCTPSANQQHRRYVLKKGNRPVKCVETGIVYESIKQAACLHGSHIPNIVRACQRGTTAAGFHWQHAERN